MVDEHLIVVLQWHIHSGCVHSGHIHCYQRHCIHHAKLSSTDISYVGTV